MSDFTNLPEDEKELAKQLGLTEADLHVLHLILVRKSVLKDSIKQYEELIVEKKEAIKALELKYKMILNKIN